MCIILFKEDGNIKIAFFGNKFWNIKQRLIFLIVSSQLFKLQQNIMAKDDS